MNRLKKWFTRVFMSSTTRQDKIALIKGCDKVYFNGKLMDKVYVDGVLEHTRIKE